eukprot:jgi/Galph1/1813/GphlegSOOS_G482.1
MIIKLSTSIVCSYYKYNKIGKYTGAVRYRNIKEDCFTPCYIPHRGYVPWSRKAVNGSADNLKEEENSAAILEKGFWGVSVSQVLSHKPRELFITEGKLPLSEAVQFMNGKHIEGLQVVASKSPNAPWLGLFSERDFVRIVATHNSADFTSMTLAEATKKSHQQVTCGLYESIRDCVYRMKKFKLQLVPLVSRPNSPPENITRTSCAQVVSTSDLNKMLLSTSSSGLQFLEQFTIADILLQVSQEGRNTDNVVTVDAEESVAVACSTMIENRVGCVVVSNKGEQSPLNPYPNYKGIFTQRDLVRRYSKDGKKVLFEPIGRMISEQRYEVLTPNYTVFEALELLNAANCKYFPVFSSDISDAQDLTSRCLAILSIRNVLTSLLSFMPSKSNNKTV